MIHQFIVNYANDNAMVSIAVIHQLAMNFVVKLYFELLDTDFHGQWLKRYRINLYKPNK